jgi:hypothetical protein
LGRVSRGAEKGIAVKLFEKLTGKLPKTGEARLRELGAVKEKLIAERAAVEKELSGHAERRSAMILSDKSEKEILAFEALFDELQIKLEKIGEQISFVDSEVAKASEAQAFSRWLIIHDRRLDAARQYAEALAEVQRVYLLFCQVRAQSLAPEFRSIHTSFGFVPVPPSPPQLELFKRQIEALEDLEAERKATATEP